MTGDPAGPGGAAPQAPDAPEPRKRGELGLMSLLWWGVLVVALFLAYRFFFAGRSAGAPG